MASLNKKEMIKYKKLVNKYRYLFYQIYGKYPILFEHGSSINCRTSASVVHAHIHIVNHNFNNETEIIQKLFRNCI